MSNAAAPVPPLVFTFEEGDELKTQKSFGHRHPLTAETL